MLIYIARFSETVTLLMQ